MDNVGGSPLEYSDTLRRRVRVGDWSEQQVGTLTRIREALEAGDRTRAADLAEYFLDEVEIIGGIYREWIPGIYAFLADQGLSDSETASLRADLMETLRLPDGRPFDADALWTQLVAQVNAFAGGCHGGEETADIDSVSEFKETWRRLHDRQVDHCYGLMDTLVRRFGEERLIDLYKVLLVPWFKTRYEQFDVSKVKWSDALEILMYVAIEAMRAHLAGSERDGDMEFFEEDDRFGVRFAPCGSGGLTFTGDPAEGTPPRTDPPRSWGVLEGEHDWAWRKKGVCYYCAHCCVILEQMPIDAFGYPARVVEPPARGQPGDDRCTWYMYKDPTQVPEHYYERVGREKPDRFGSARTHAGGAGT
jgi:hypothetical protein